MAIRRKNTLEENIEYSSLSQPLITPGFNQSVTPIVTEDLIANEALKKLGGFLQKKALNSNLGLSPESKRIMKPIVDTDDLMIFKRENLRKESSQILDSVEKDQSLTSNCEDQSVDKHHKSEIYSNWHEVMHSLCAESIKVSEEKYFSLPDQNLRFKDSITKIMEKKKLFCSLTNECKVLCCDIKDNFAAYGGENGKITIIRFRGLDVHPVVDFHHSHKLCEVARRGVESVSFGKSTRSFVTGGHDGNVILWKLDEDTNQVMKIWQRFDLEKEL